MKRNHMRWAATVAIVGLYGIVAGPVRVSAQTSTPRYPWSSFANDPQHTGNSLNPSQNLVKIFWTAPVDLQPQYSGSNLLIHYGSPLCTKVNILLIPVKTGKSDFFRVDARRASNGSIRWSMDTDYRMPPHNWGVPMGITLTPNNVLYMPGAGGKLLWRKQVDSATGPTGTVVFYGQANYDAAKATYDSNVYVHTPITSDKDGNLYFGFWVTGSTPLGLKSGIARVTKTGAATWITASDAAGDTAISKVAMNCAPALSNDQTTLYVAVHTGNRQGGYLLGLDSKTLQPKHKIRLKDVRDPTRDALLFDDGTSSPTVGPDGDVYYGVLENGLGSNHYRGWMLHYDGTLTTTKTPGAFGWDTTATIVPKEAGPPKAGSPYYLMTKYNHYVQGGGDGANKIAILDPNATQTDPVTGATVMKEVMIQVGPTPDDAFIGTHPKAVKEWCINTAAYDPFKQCVIANCEDGKVYRWNLVTNTLDQVVTLTAGLGEAYTSTIIGTDGLIYAINNATIFCVGEKRAP